MINRQQLFALFLGLVLISISMCYQPYVDEGSLMSGESYRFILNPPRSMSENGDQTFFDSFQYAFQIGLAVWCTLIAILQFRSLKNPDPDLIANLSENSILNLKKNQRRKNIYAITWVGLFGVFAFECFSWNTSIPLQIFNSLFLVFIALFVILFVQSVAFRFISRSKL